jgi:hypothetical protein
MPGTILPVVADYTLGGSIFTFAFPMALVVVVTASLYWVFSRTREVPGHKALAPAPATEAGPGDVPTTAWSSAGGASPSRPDAGPDGS